MHVYFCVDKKAALVNPEFTYGCATHGLRVSACQPPKTPLLIF